MVVETTSKDYESIIKEKLIEAQCKEIDKQVILLKNEIKQIQIVKNECDWKKELQYLFELRSKIREQADNIKTSGKINTKEDFDKSMEIWLLKEQNKSVNKRIEFLQDKLSEYNKEEIEIDEKIRYLNSLRIDITLSFEMCSDDE